MQHLVLGGARSGKSAFAEKIVLDQDKTPVYLATATALDRQMNVRIKQHQGRRKDQGWVLIEEPLAIADVLLSYNSNQYAILVDCLTLWLTNCLHHQAYEAESANLLSVLPKLESELVLVSNEVGSGVVPLGELSRTFVDLAGELHQQLAQQCDAVTLVVAGLGLSLKQ